MWKPLVEVKGDLPEPRVPFIFTEIEHGKLLLIGGFNNSGLIKDVHLFADGQWRKLNPFD